MDHLTENDDFFYLEREKDPTLGDKAKKLLTRYVEHLASKPIEELKPEEAEVVLDIQKAMRDFTVVSLGDTSGGFPATKEMFEKMKKIIMKLPDQGIILWNDKIDLRGRSTI